MGALGEIKGLSCFKEIRTSHCGIWRVWADFIFVNGEHVSLYSKNETLPGCAKEIVLWHQEYCQNSGGYG